MHAKKEDKRREKKEEEPKEKQLKWRIEENWQQIEKDAANDAEL